MDERGKPMGQAVARIGHLVFWDDQRDCLIVFGGQAQSQFVNEMENKSQ